MLPRFRGLITDIGEQLLVREPRSLAASAGAPLRADRRLRLPLSTSFCWPERIRGIGTPAAALDVARCPNRRTPPYRPPRRDAAGHPRSAVTFVRRLTFASSAPGHPSGNGESDGPRVWFTVHKGYLFPRPKIRSPKGVQSILARM